MFYSTIKNKKTLIFIGFLLGIVFILIGISSFQQRNRKNKTGTEPQPTPTSAFVAIPTGVVIPTNQISPNTLDIVALDPSDQAENVGLTQPLRITFSTARIAEGAIKVYFDPPVERDIRYEGNTMIISPKTAWESGVLYRYSLNFADNPYQNRVYSFRVQGTPQPVSQNTRDAEVIEEEMLIMREKYPDIYVSYLLPYETQYFSADYNPIPADGEHDFTVTLKGDDREAARQAFIDWLLSKELRQEQIQTLDIEYQ